MPEHGVPVFEADLELDRVYELPYRRRPHGAYGEARMPAWEMIRFSVNIMRGCFGGCTFCSITEHEGRIIQSRSEASVLREVKTIASKSYFKGHISDLGGPTANMWRLGCSKPEVQEKCRRLSCVHPTVCKMLNTDHKPLVELMKKARTVDGVTKVHIASGIRMDLANLDEQPAPNCWYVGDSTTDTTASKFAGVTSVFFNGAQWSDAWINRIFPGTPRYPHKPDTIVDDFGEFSELVRMSADRPGC